MPEYCLKFIVTDIHDSVRSGIKNHTTQIHLTPEEISNGQAASYHNDKTCAYSYRNDGNFEKKCQI